MQSQAIAKNIRISSEKVNLVVAQIKKLSPLEAIEVLNFVQKSAAPVILKLIKSAIANAKNNQGAVEGNLKFKEIIVTKGPSYKRFQPVSRGRAHHILKRTSHITVILESDDKKAETKKSAKVAEKPIETRDAVAAKGVKNGTKS